MGRKRVAEPVPVQVYLDQAASRRLERLTERLDASKSEVLRRGIEALERELTDPAAHPMLRLIGLAEERTDAAGPDPAREHDRVLAEAEEERWRARPGGASRGA
jgi:Arc/MetJ-type ribon-helix-helix transcriptional regulator